MQQVGLYLIRHPHRYYKMVEQELIDTGESYESYCYNVFHSKVWGDDLIAAVFSDMWNLAIMIITPVFKYGVDLFHTKEEPDIVLICNSGGYMEEKKRSTHFSSTKPIGVNVRKPGIDLVNHMVGINPELVYKKLELSVVDDANLARRIAIDEYINDEKEKSLQLLHSMMRGIEKLDNHIAELI